MKKLYIVNKFVVASSIAEAIRLEKNQKPDQIWLDDDWKKANMPHTDDPSKAGFK